MGKAHARPRPFGLLAGAVGACLALASNPAARADVTLKFNAITQNNPNDAAVGEAQLSVVVSDPGNHQANFTFRNDGPAESSIFGVYFDDGALLGIAGIIEGPGTYFSEGARPPDLPGANNINPVFETHKGFLADADPPPAHSGVNPGEWVTIVFNLLPEADFNDVLTFLADGGLRIGIHVGDFADGGNFVNWGGSESFVNVPLSVSNPIPAPGAVLLVAAGIGAFAWVRRRPADL